MKNDNQPKHTQGELIIKEKKERPQSVYITDSSGSELFAINFGPNEFLRSKVEAMEYAQRIVYAVNNIDRLDHENKALIDMLCELRGYREAMSVLKEDVIEDIDGLIKQAKDK